MNRRELRFAGYDDLLAEIDRLERLGYRQVGQWSLGRMCKHLAYYFRGSLEGFDFRLPWLVRRLIGRPMLRRLLKRNSMGKGGARTIPASVPAEGIDERAAIAEAVGLVRRLKAATTELHPSPLFGQLTPDVWRQLHLLHAAHHLSFLVPDEAT